MLLAACSPVAQAPPPLAASTPCNGDLPACVAKAQALARAERPDAEAAARLYDAACAQNAADACEHLADLHFDGRLVDATRGRALALADQACGLGRASACALAGFVLAAEGHDADARVRWERGCAAGDGKACANLSVFLHKGRGGPPDEARSALFAARANELARAGCARHDARECGFLGKTLAREGHALEAVAPLELACRGRDDAACVLLGTGLAAGGAGVTADSARAQSILSLGCRDGGADTCSRLGTFAYLNGDVPGAAVATQRSCDLGSGEGCYQLAALLLKATPPDSPRVIAALDRSCALRYPGGCSGEASELLKGAGFGPDDVWREGRRDEPTFARARTLFVRSCELEPMCADDECTRFAAFGCNAAGLLHQVGRGGDADPAAARAYFTRACKLGNQAACQSLEKHGP